MMKYIMFLIFSMMLLFFNFPIMILVSLFFILSFMYLFDLKFVGFDFIISSGYLGLDKSSYVLVLLTFWVVSLMMMSLGDSVSDFHKIFIFFSISLVLILFFSSLNLLLLYFFFEVSLIPTYFIIIYWGSNPERISASFYLVVYMLLISIPLFIYIMWIESLSGTLSTLILFKDMVEEFGFWECLVILGSFLIKLPMYFFHLWLPKAHVEAPVYGSMILAAILLKLGGYGLYRMILIVKINIVLKEMLISLGMSGAFMVSLLSAIQVDMKSLVAYSSVVHMNLMMSGLMTEMWVGFLSCLIIMVSHGLCSSGLFYMVNMYYERSASRLLILNKGMINYIPSMTIWWFFLCSSNFSYPLSLNFFGEITLFMTLLSWEYSQLILLSFICFFSSFYSLYLFSYVQHGAGNLNNFMSGALVKEYTVVILHYVPLVLIILDLLVFY